jgi:hypothetical protein
MLRADGKLKTIEDYVRDAFGTDMLPVTRTDSFAYNMLLAAIRRDRAAERFVPPDPLWGNCTEYNGLTLPGRYGAMTESLFPSFSNFSSMLEEVRQEAPPEPEFPVDLVEPLAGWKQVYFQEENGYLWSNFDTIWEPLKRLAASCHMPRPGHEGVVVLHCSCGIYAVDERYVREWDSDGILIEVYGWGRYVRGDAGWRAQYAYPKAIHLRRHQAHLLHALRRYRVPIFVEREAVEYIPTEDGYEYRNNETDGNI